jgi:hypothetical protein
MSGYNYDGFSATDYDFAKSAGPELGSKAPDCQVFDLDGNPRQLLDFEGDFLVLEMGSLTCPLFQTRRGKMERLKTGDTQISNVILYIREAHPGAGIPQHKSFDDKRACARRLMDDDGETRRILVDDLRGTAHQAYGSMPNTLFIINRNGCVVFRAEWNNSTATQAALNALIAGAPLRVRTYFRPGLPILSMKTLQRAGKGSGSDFLRSFPSLVWNNLIKRNLRTLFNRPDVLSRDTTC